MFELIVGKQTRLLIFLISGFPYGVGAAWFVYFSRNRKFSFPRPTGKKLSHRRRLSKVDLEDIDLPAAASGFIRGRTFRICNLARHEPAKSS